MNGAFLTKHYWLGHLAAAVACFVLVAILPFVAYLAASIVAGDIGGPLFWPIFLVALIFGSLALAVILSGIILICDMVRARWGFPFWIAPLIVFIAILSLELLVLGVTPTAIANGVLLGFSAGFVLSFYKLAVSRAWFLPRLLAYIFRVSPPSHDERKSRNA